MGPPDDWRRRVGRPRQSWLRTVEADLRPMNLGLAMSKRRAHCSGQIDMAETHSNGYIYDKLLKKKDCCVN